MTDAPAHLHELSPSMTGLHAYRTTREVLDSARAHYERGMPEAGQEADGPEEAPETKARGVPANWLDALPEDRYEQPEIDEDHISAVNSDDTGLYRMFLNHSP